MLVVLIINYQKFASKENITLLDCTNKVSQYKRYQKKLYHTFEILHKILSKLESFELSKTPAVTLNFMEFNCSDWWVSKSEPPFWTAPTEFFRNWSAKFKTCFSSVNSNWLFFNALKFVVKSYRFFSACCKSVSRSAMALGFGTPGSIAEKNLQKSVICFHALQSIRLGPKKALHYLKTPITSLLSLEKSSFI